MRQRAPMLIGSFCLLALLAGLILWSARPTQVGPPLPRQPLTATPTPSPTPLPSTPSPAPETPPPTAPPTPEPTAGVATATPSTEDAKSADWPALYLMDDRIHDAYTLKKLNDINGLREMLPDLKSAIDVVLSEPPAKFPGADGAWIQRRLGDLRTQAPALDNASGMTDEAVYEMVELLVQLVEVMMSAADTTHIAVHGGEVPWLKSAPMPQQMPADDSGDMVTDESQY